MGKLKHSWQDIGYILKLFDAGKRSIARRRYREFIEKGISDGRRHDLTGGGLLRSAGGWSIVKTLRRRESRMKGDERILGDGDFVEIVLKAAQEKLDRKYKIQSQGYSFEHLVEHVAKLFDITKEELLSGAKYPETVQDRSVVCFWGHRELGISTVELSKKLKILQPTASQSVARGQKIVQERMLFLFENNRNQ
jgi:hypothetical protein